MPNTWPKVRLRPERYEQMTQEAYMQGTSLAQVIEDALEVVYPRAPKPKKRPATAPSKRLTAHQRLEEQKAVKQVKRPTRRIRRMP